MGCLALEVRGKILTRDTSPSSSIASSKSSPWTLLAGAFPPGLSSIARAVREACKNASSLSSAVKSSEPRRLQSPDGQVTPRVRLRSVEHRAAVLDRLLSRAIGALEVSESDLAIPPDAAAEYGRMGPGM